MSKYVDIPIDCVDCRQPFTWSAEEQEFYADKGFTQPKRCRQCRRARQQQREEGRAGRREPGDNTRRGSR